MNRVTIDVRKYWEGALARIEREARTTVVVLTSF